MLMEKFEKNPKSRRRLCGRSSRSFKDHKGLGFFVCLTFKQRFLTNMERVRRGIGHSSACGIYGHISEDMLHSIRDCPTTRDIWNLLIPTDQIVYLNSNGSVKLEDGSASAGGITDGLEVVIAIQEGLTEGFNPALIRRILQLFSQFQHWSIFHIPREENEEVDRLVKLTHLDSQGLQVFEV
ncbi:hypothetical protein Gorai_016158, partial [Gossypium raimondii]|nr:hypothetical protein [Gossypium raimondii]